MIVNCTSGNDPLQFTCTKCLFNTNIVGNHLPLENAGFMSQYKSCVGNLYHYQRNSNCWQRLCLPPDDFVSSGLKQKTHQLNNVVNGVLQPWSTNICPCSVNVNDVGFSFFGLDLVVSELNSSLTSSLDANTQDFFARAKC
jgi:hypothetical protein